MLATLLPLVHHHHFHGDCEVRFDDHEDRFGENNLNIINCEFFLADIRFILLTRLMCRYLTVTICGEACPCPHSVVVTLFWIGNCSEEKH